jgi:uncharacterized protein
MTQPDLSQAYTEPLMPRLERAIARRFYIMVKPSGAQCNLACSYCYYLHKQELLRQTPAPRMSDTVLQAHIRQYIEAQSSDEVVFSWQGGEPTLMRLDFFRRVIELQQQYRQPGQRIENDFQTNGILLDDAWCSFLKEHGFLVGLSVDGPAALHDALRRGKGGAPTLDRVMRSVRLLHRHEIAFSALCVVNRVNARRPLDVYGFLRDQVRPRMIQFIPALEPVRFRSVAPGYWHPEAMPVVGTLQAGPGQPDSAVTGWSVDPNDWGHFLVRVWDEWFERDYGQVFVDQFENVISQLFGYGPQSCVTAPVCGNALALEHDGGLYSCDHFVYPEYKLGSIGSAHEGDLAQSERQEAFGSDKHGTLTPYCRLCEYLSLCWGDCPKNRFVKSPAGEPGLSYLCPGLKQFFAKVVAARSELQKRLSARSVVSDANCYRSN